MLDKFADELREQREKSGLSLHQIATKTRIDIKFLEAIDQGNFAFLPDLYVKAFVKQYAKTIGLDESITLKKFEAAREGKEYDPNEQTIQKPAKEETAKPEPLRNQQTAPVKPAVTQKTFFENPLEKNPDDERKNSKQNQLYIIAALVLVAIFILLYFFAFNKNDKIIVEETPIEESIEQKDQRYEEEPVETVTNLDSIAPVSADSLYLTFIATEPSWIYTILDEKVVKEFTLSPGSKFSIAAANNFKATVGNSGGIKLQLNNNPVEFSGRSGSVRHFKLDRNEFIYLNAPPKLEQ
jgi:cytoskeletal protein RodZ